MKKRWGINKEKEKEREKEKMGNESWNALMWRRGCLLSWMKISDISAEISVKYRISATTEAKSVMKICLREKSLKNRKFRWYFVDISVSDRNFDEISASETHTRVGYFLFQNIEDISEISGKYRRYIENIDKNIEDISAIYRDISGYIENISKWLDLKS